MQGADITIDTRGLRRSITVTVVLLAVLFTVQKLVTVYIVSRAAGRSPG